jgi:hypothetical protein
LNKLFVSLSAAALFIALGSPAGAYFVTYSAGPNSTIGGDITFDEAGITANTYPSISTGNGNITSLPGVTFSGTGIVVNNVVNHVLQGSAGVYAAPPGDTTNYMAVLGGQSETLTFSSAKDIFGLLWGSIDTYNHLTFSNSHIPGSSLTISGSDLPTPPTIPFGDQSSPNSNHYVTISGLNFDTVLITSGSNSFEFDNVAAAAPEPSTWAMMILGFLGVGAMSYRRSKRRGLNQALSL